MTKAGQTTSNWMKTATETELCTLPIETDKTILFCDLILSLKKNEFLETNGINLKYFVLSFTKF